MDIFTLLDEMQAIARAVVHLCEVAGGELQLSHEGNALKYWHIDQMQNWHATHETYARAAYEMWKSERWLPAISA